MKVPVAYEEAYNAYRAVITWTIGQHRPHFTLLGTTPAALGPTLQRFEPPERRVPGRVSGAASRVVPTRGGLCVGGDREGTDNPGIGRVLAEAC